MVGNHRYQWSIDSQVVSTITEAFCTQCHGCVDRYRGNATVVSEGVGTNGGDERHIIVRKYDVSDSCTRLECIIRYSCHFGQDNLVEVQSRTLMEHPRTHGCDIR